MKKILFIALMLITSSTIYAGSGAMKVINNTSCDYYVELYANSPTWTGATTCSDIKTSFVIPAGKTYTWSDPYDVEISTSYCAACGALTPVGWITLPPPATTLNVCGVGPCWAAFTSYYPLDWYWTYGFISPTLNSCNCIISLLGSSSCSGTGGTIPYICSPAMLNTTWQYIGVSPFDIVVTING